MRRKLLIVVPLAIAIIVISASYFIYQNKITQTGTGAQKQYKIDVAEAEVRNKQQEFEKKKENIDIVLPQKIYALEGTTNSLFLQNVIRADWDDLNVKLESSSSELTEGNRVSLINLKVNDSEKLTINLQDKEMKDLMETSHQVEIVSKQNQEKVSLLSIGDSMTRPNTYGARIEEVLPNVQTIGTRTFNNGLTNGEGRGGWTLEAYMNRIGEIDGGDSPFLFPKEISALQYKGNVNFWKNVCYGESGQYDYDGFQKTAQGWDGNECLYDKSGYPKEAIKNDVVVDPEASINDVFMEFNGSEWQPMDPQPEVEFNFSKYVEKNKVALNGDPTVVTLLFGANDYYAKKGLPGINKFINNVDEINESIKSYNPEIKLIVNLPIVGSNQETWTKFDKEIGNAELYKENMQLLGRVLIDEYDKREEEGIYVSPTNVFLDTSQLVDNIHPNESGYNQMGDTLGALIQKIR